VNVKIYVEGGGDANALRTRCRRGFRRFFESAGLTGRMPAIVACGSREDTYASFRTAVTNAAKTKTLPLLLVDSEQPVNSSVWSHLSEHDGWQKPAGTEDRQAHLMVECMESWFLADRDCLARFFGQGFKGNALPSRTDIEQIPKADVLNGLKQATRRSKTRGQYRKSEHSFELLGQLDARAVRTAAPHVDRLVSTLEAG